jgi:hypothetical protein
VVVGLGADRDRVVSGGGGFVVAEPGAGGGVIEDLDDLGAEAAGELAVPAGRVLPGDPALLVRGGAERQVCLTEQPVVGDDAVAGRADARQAGAHRLSTLIAPRAPRAAPALTARAVPGRTPVTTRTSPACTVTGAPSAATASTRSGAGSPAPDR